MKTLMSPEQIQFRDELFSERFKNERHTHHAYYTDEGELLRKCARCHGELSDEIHAPLDGSVIDKAVEQVILAEKRSQQ